MFQEEFACLRDICVDLLFVLPGGFFTVEYLQIRLNIYVM
jgi:hypothetical protein